MSLRRALIVEDNFQTAEKLREYIGIRPELDLIGVAGTGTEALRVIASGMPDLLLLDIHLPDMSGFDILEHLEDLPYIIFITAYDQFAVRAFEIGAIDYILKPFPESRLQQAIERYLEIGDRRSKNIRSLQNLGFHFQEKGRRYLLAHDDIIYISAHGKHTVLHTVFRDIEIRKMLKEVRESIPPEIFVRTHRQFIVNTKYILKLEHEKSGHYRLHLKDESSTTLPVGREFAAGVKTIFESC